MNETFRFLWDSETLSTVRSEFYANRFLSFMTKNLLADEVSVIIDADERFEPFPFFLISCSL